MNEKFGATVKLLMVIRSILILPIWLYQKLISPLIPSRCIYTPSCSEYNREAVLKHGLRGFLLGGARVLRCMEGLYTGGDDPVPDRFSFSYLFGSYRKFWRGKDC